MFANGSTRWAGQVLSLFRIVTALLFLEHATQKLFAFPVAYTFGSTAPGSFAWTLGLFELVGGTLILLGWFTRPVAFLLSGFMAVGYFVVHGAQGLFPIANGGEQAIMFCFGFLLLWTVGPGSWSLDRRSAGTGVTYD